MRLSLDRNRHGAVLTLFLALLAATPRLGVAIIVNDTGDDKTSNNGLCTLREAVQTAYDLSNGQMSSYPECKIGTGPAVITFKSGLGTIEILKPEDPIFLSSNLTIKGPATISGGKRSRIFEVGSAVTIVLDHLVLNEGFDTGAGGAILITSGNANVTLESCQLIGNEAQELGGALANSGSTVTIHNSEFRANRAGTRGGALSGGGPWTIQDSEFNSNLAAQGGGAVYCTANALTIERSHFISNTAAGEKTPSGYVDGGGAVMSGCINTILQSSFEVNDAFGQMGGGALYLTSSAQGSVTQSVFTGNDTGFGDEPGGGGGAILVQGSVMIDRCVIYKNIARLGYGGGGILFWNSSYSTVVNSAILLNTSTSDDLYNPDKAPANGYKGAGISAVGVGLVEVIASSLFDNKGTDEIYLEGAQEVMTLKNTLIDSWFTQATCAGELNNILDGEKGKGGSNLQASVNNTCNIKVGVIGSKLTDGSFPFSTPGGPLKFQYPVPDIFGDAHEGGDPATCNTFPVSSFDLLDELRGDLCTVGAVELP